jgi:hypothetical protein
LAAGGVTEIAGIRTRPLVSELCGYAGLCPFDQGKVLPHANKWLSARLRRGRLACHRLLGLLRDFYKRKRALGKESKIALMY